jgi:mono/diheme cytochrome c family protein
MEGLTMPERRGKKVRIMNKLIGAIGVAVVAIGSYAYWQTTSTSSQGVAIEQPGAALVDVILPATLSETAQMGRLAYDGVCASCHGPNAAGQNGVAPPLVHRIYEPNHHADEAFQRAAANGVRSHHWTFGDMPPVEGVTRGDVTMIAAYIRELQRANGIF